MPGHWSRSAKRGITALIYRKLPRNPRQPLHMKTKEKTCYFQKEVDLHNDENTGYGRFEESIVLGGQKCDSNEEKIR